MCIVLPHVLLISLVSFLLSPPPSSKYRAFAGAEAASDRLCISTNGTVQQPISAQDVCFCASSDGCQGGQIDTPWDYISQSGAVTGGQVDGTYAIGKGGFCSDFTLPHCHHHGPQVRKTTIRRGEWVGG